MPPDAEVYVVDDDSAVRDSLRSLLELEGFQVSVFASGAAFLQSLEPAARGVIFDDCYATTNVTSPSHVALMTAQHPRDTRVVSNTGRMSADAQGARKPRPGTRNRSPVSGTSSHGQQGLSCICG